MDSEPLPTYRQLVISVLRHAAQLGFGGDFRTIRHKAGDWLQLWIADAQPDLDAGIFLLTAGIHGTEVAGPLTIYRRLPEIVAATRAAGLRLVCCPLLNPSGYDHRGNAKDRVPDRNVDNDGGAAGNNDFLRYLLDDGSWVWNLDGRDFTEWRWSSDPEIGERQPAETLVAHEYLKELDWEDVVAALDIHADNLTTNLSCPAGTYQYPFGDPERFDEIGECAGKVIPTYVNSPVRFSRTDPNDVVMTDAKGNIPNFHDGSLSDLAHRAGVPNVATIETFGAEVEAAIKVSMVWIHGFCRLATNRRP